MDFLSGEEFEKMAKAYNEKYNKASVMSQSNILLQNVLQNVNGVMVFLNKTGKGNENFDSLANSLYGKCTFLQAKFGINVLPQKKIYTYKDCYLVSLKTLLDIENLQNGHNFEDFEMLKKDFLEAIICFFEGF
jgi:hypothetical protein